MREIAPNLFVGSADDFEREVKGRDGWAVVHACKEPYHRRLLGYTERAAPKDHPEYLMARRGSELFLNLVDAPRVEYIPAEVIDAALAFIGAALAEGKKVLVHCNQGESRAPSIGLLYLASIGQSDIVKTFPSIYPEYKPAAGMAAFVQQRLGGR